MSIEQDYINIYNTQREALMQHSVPCFNNLRDKAFQSFCRLRFPSRKVEEYRYTDTSQQFAYNYGLSLRNTPVEDKEVANYYGKLADVEADALVALNTMFAQDCVFVRVPHDTTLKTPILIDNKLGGEIDAMVFRRIIIVLEEHSSATIQITDRATTRQHFLSNQVIEVFAANGSHLDMYEIERTHIDCVRFSNLFMQIGSDCRVTHNNITLFNGVTRNSINVKMIGESSKVNMNGCAIATGNQHIDNNTIIQHISPSCQSDQLYKYYVDDKATGAFAGKILVQKGAQKTISEEINQNICATKTAKMFAQPMLEIYADDVKCNHGSTVGKLDDTALFYMSQRGIPMPEARNMLIQSFIQQVIERFEYASLRDHLIILLGKRLHGELDKCGDCPTQCK